jgi:hypothetical protein
VTRCVDDCHVVLGGLELPKSNVDGDTSLSLGLKFVKNPCVLEGWKSALIHTVNKSRILISRRVEDSVGKG